MATRGICAGGAVSEGQAGNGGWGHFRGAVVPRSVGRSGYLLTGLEQVQRPVGAIPKLGQELAAPHQGLAQPLPHALDVPLQLLQLARARGTSWAVRQAGGPSSRARGSSLVVRPHPGQLQAWQWSPGVPAGSAPCAPSPRPLAPASSPRDSRGQLACPAAAAPQDHWGQVMGGTGLVSLQGRGICTLPGALLGQCP